MFFLTIIALAAGLAVWLATDYDVIGIVVFATAAAWLIVQVTLYIAALRTMRSMAAMIQDEFDRAGRRRGF